MERSLQFEVVSGQQNQTTMHVALKKGLIKPLFQPLLRYGKEE